MFGWFKKKDKAVKANDIVFATSEAKWKALSEVSRQEPLSVFIAWFEDTLDHLQQQFQRQGINAELLLYRNLHSGIAGDRPLIFVEHYPLAAREQQLFSSFHKNSITVYSSLDESFFKHFGGERISAMLGKMGLQENEAISHPMISKAIRNAQDKLAQKITIEQTAHSSDEWMHRNTGTILPA